MLNGIQPRAGLFAHLGQDGPAGVVVFLVALPLCLGIALASDAPLMSGLITGVIAGTVVAWLSGSQLSVSGPAAGLTVIVAGGIQSQGSFPAFLAAVVLCGVMQIVFGALRAGVLGSFFPSSVIKGMLAAIGFIIILKQIPHALGRDADYEGDLAFFQFMDQENTFSEILVAIQTMQPGMLVVALVSMAVLLGWDSRPIKRLRWAAWIPGPLLAVAAGTLVNALYGALAPGLAAVPGSEHMVALPVIRSLGDVNEILVFPDLAAFALPATWTLALTLAAVASLETLLSVEATDKLDPCKRLSPPNRELVAQGVGNILAGAIGGLPMTAVIVRSSANVYAGARTRLSAVVHGLLLAGSFLLIPGVLNQIPLASLAAVLILIGYKLARVSLFKQLYHAGMGQFVPFLVTFVAVVFTDLLTGVLIGLVVGLVVVLRASFYSAVRVVRHEDDFLIKFSRDVSFINKIKLTQVLRSVPDGASVLIDGSAALYIDSDIREVIRDFQDSARHRNIQVEIKNIPAAKGSAS
jgi:MFS superfamily sulfate permease-like transporter